ncbi:coat protein [Striga asiatica]|uniref:Coat protein n=1 Tax=Striga asiatica TaxID=4170 RepID=A0A5A7QQ87_STRAF|nr:coat protein [Striga asiatica]
MGNKAISDRFDQLLAEAESQQVFSQYKLSDEQMRSITQFLNTPVQPVTHNNIVMKFYEPPVNNITDWKDKCFKGKEGYEFQHFASVNAIEREGEEVFGEIIHGDLRKSTVIRLMRLAFNLLDASLNPLFGSIDSEILSTTIPIPTAAALDRILILRHADGVPHRITHTSVHHNNPKETQMVQRAIAYCYLAASYIRLYTKSVDNFATIAEQLRSRFSNFYGFPFPFINGYHPDRARIEAIKNHLERHNELLRNTIYAVLYAGATNPRGKNIKDFLYDNHISYTGLHAFSLFSQCIDLYRIPYGDLIDVLHSQRIEPQLESMAAIFNKLMPGEDEEYAAQMWKYARIFGKNFLSNLQTKKCKFFTMVLAYLVHVAAETRNQQNVLNIVQISDLGEMEKHCALRYAKRACELIADKMHGGKKGIV